MDIQRYYQQRQEQAEKAPKYRELCTQCIQPVFSCYCKHIQKFDSNIQFVVLIHPIEVRRRIATGRMAHLCLENSHLIMGQDYSREVTVNRLLQDPDNHCVILYPGKQSKNLSPMSEAERSSLFPQNKKLTVFVIDGTWATARRTIRQSQNLNKLPRICFSPERPSSFRVRKQPNAACYSTIEAIHQSIELIGTSQGFNVSSRGHDKLLHVFDKMVELQLEFIRISESKPNALRYRRRGPRSA
ncbi:tRNA-uridine aminocarboxypropyltransferase [Bdellovibrio sp. HCB337]|uniref:tRNA-uridine aminocarboxypropyltransferase n=1 Tax=Bdellovibrio sp. HCB337 TaxID=3394358 RepID=UPI0039A43CEA